ncbi:penicillin-binding protein 2 [Metabacillus indicus]|uniref:peptidoglycan D,D-transpeptidase FtsI family protein n=1 Tax=Metabacillus indicus TaxID=246786 RepID=UPI003181AB23
MIIKKRMKWTGVFIFICMLVLIARLADIQLINTESFGGENVNLIEESVGQRTQEVMIDDGRGRFVDRNLLPVGNFQEPKLVLFPFLKNIEWPKEKLAQIIGYSAFALKNMLEDADKPLIMGSAEGITLTESQMDAINDLEIPGVFAIYQQAKKKDEAANHIIGITGESPDVLRERYPDKKELSSKTQVGFTGLEKAFDEFLLPDAETKLLYHVDGDGNPLFGINVKYIANANPFYPVSVKTTIDSRIQNMADAIVTKYGIKKGGLVLLDAETSEVLAMVSKPALERSDSGSHINHMLTPQIPGSVFKTVIAAAAIESGLKLKNSYNCQLDMYGEHDDDSDMGTLNFERSFARSCNYTFTTTADELIKKDKQTIEEFAGKLGLTEKNGWSGNVFHYNQFRQFPEEKSPSIWDDPRDKGAFRAVAQTAIGQKNVRVTPLAAANMMATIARGGVKKQVKIADSILYKNGTTMFEFPDQDMEGDGISPYTASKLQHLLRLVVTDKDGTGRRFQSLPFEVSGKSGTAETGHKTVHKWFAGYFPSNNPKYALAVVELDTQSETSSANSIFYDVAAELSRLENASTR